MRDMREYDNIARISGADARKCMRCGKCSAACPFYGEMEYHPHQFVYMIEKCDFEPLIESESLYRCLSCMVCAERCPRGVEPSRLIEAVRVLSIRRQGKNHLKTDEVPDKIDPELPQQAIVSALRKYAK